MQQTKYCNNVILMSESGRTKNKQIKTHETHTALPDMKHIIVDNVNAPLYS